MNTLNIAVYSRPDDPPCIIQSSGKFRVQVSSVVCSVMSIVLLEKVRIA